MVGPLAVAGGIFAKTVPEGLLNTSPCPKVWTRSVRLERFNAEAAAILFKLARRVKLSPHQ